MAPSSRLHLPVFLLLAIDKLTIVCPADYSALLLEHFASFQCCYQTGLRVVTNSQLFAGVSARHGGNTSLHKICCSHEYVEQPGQTPRERDGISSSFCLMTAICAMVCCLRFESERGVADRSTVTCRDHPVSKKMRRRLQLCVIYRP